MPEEPLIVEAEIIDRDSGSILVLGSGLQTRTIWMSDEEAAVQAAMYLNREKKVDAIGQRSE